LTDRDRAGLAEKDVGLSDGRGESMLHELSIYTALSKPTEYLELSYAASAIDGKAANPSGLISKLRRIFPGLEAELADDFTITAPEPVFGATAALLGAAREGGVTPEAMDGALDFFIKDDAYRERLTRMTDVAEHGLRCGDLSPESAAKLYGDEIRTSASRLEKYAACPFAYFVRYNLNARERRIYEVMSVDLGVLLHEILAEFTRLISLAGLRLKDVTESDIERYVEEAFDNLKDLPENEVFFSSASYSHLIGRTMRVAKRSVWALAEHMRLGDFTELGAEIGFTSDAPITEIRLDGGGRRFILTGRVDRVDVLDFNGVTYVKIIDYKSGAVKFDRDDVYAGTQMQLALYLGYFMKQFKRGARVLPGGIFYFNLADPVVDADAFDYASGDPYAALNEKILSEFKMSGLTLADRDIVRRIDRNAGTSSLVLSNVGFNKSSATGFKSGAAVADEAGFEELLTRVADKVKEIGRGMVSGAIRPRPYQKGPAAACRYCSYGGICGYEARGE